MLVLQQPIKNTGFLTLQGFFSNEQKFVAIAHPTNFWQGKVSFLVDLGMLSMQFRPYQKLLMTSNCFTDGLLKMLQMFFVSVNLSKLKKRGNLA